MKKILYIVSLFALVFASCDPMEDIYKDVDALGIDNNVRSLDYTLTDDDYSDIGGDPEKYGSFSIYDAAADHLPDFLAKMYPTLDVTSTINVTYDFYQGGLDYIRNYEKLNYFQLTVEDYDAMGTDNGEPGKYNNFAYNVLPEDFLPDYLPTVYENVESGFTVEVNFKYYSNYVTSIVSEYWAFNGTVWANAALDSHTLTTEDYDSMGTEKDEPGEYGNFAYDVDPLDFLPAFLADKYLDAVANDLVDLTYLYYDGSETLTIKEYYSFDGSTWNVYLSGIVIPSGIKGYELAEEDYNSMGFEEMLDSEDDTEMFTTFVNLKFPYAVNGDVYAISFKYLDDDVIKKGAVELSKVDNVWEAYQSTIAKTDQYVNSTAGWVYDPSVLYTMVAEDYLMIVDYVSSNLGTEYVDSYGTAEAYYGANSYYVEFNIKEGNYDTSFATWQDAVKAGVAVYLPVKYPDAKAQVDGVDVSYIITFAGYESSMVDYTITFKCTKSGPSPEFEYIEGPTLK
jgi:hypothetical protein